MKMKFRWPWQKKKEDELDVFAQELEALLQPVQPREDFVMGLRDNLLAKPKPAWLPLPKMGWQLFLWIGGGIISVVLVILGGIRVVANLLNRKKTKEVKTLKEDVQETPLDSPAKDAKGSV